MTVLIIVALAFIGLSLMAKREAKVAKPLAGEIKPPDVTQLERMVVEVQPGQMDAVKAKAKELGAEVETSYRDLLQILILVKNIKQLEAHPDVIRIREPMYMEPA